MTRQLRDTHNMGKESVMNTKFDSISSINPQHVAHRQGPRGATLALLAWMALGFTVPILDARGQGQIVLNNRINAGGASAFNQTGHIWGPSATAPTLALIGLGSNDNPSGTTPFGSASGMVLIGQGTNGYTSTSQDAYHLGYRTTLAQLIGAVGQNMPESSLVPLAGVTTFRTGTALGCVAQINSVFTNNPASPDAPWATVQIVAWDNTSGFFPTWAEASAAWKSGFIAAGHSGLFNVANIGGPSNSWPTLTSAGQPIPGFSFNLCVPNSLGPTLATLPATAISFTKATLNGAVNPNGYPTAAWFEWGTSTSYGTRTALIELGSGTNALPVTASIGGLTPGVTYHFRVVATNSLGRVEGGDRSFTTAANAAGAILEIQAFIGGRDRLLIRSNTLQWLHYEKAAVGRWQGNNEPTIISTTLGAQTVMSNAAWVPTWPEPPPAEIRYPANSSVFTALTPILPAAENQPITLIPITAPALVNIVEYPSASNNFALLVEFNDTYLLGAAFWYHISLSFGSVPSVSCRPPGQTAEQGTTVTWLADVLGSPPLAYQWFHSGTNVPADPAYSHLTLPNIQLSQAGSWTVVVTNAFGMATSSPAMLSVIVPVAHRAAQSLTLMGEAGSTLNLDYVDSLSATPNWFSLDIVTLASTSEAYFDLTDPLPPQRYYRTWQTGSPSRAPSLDLWGQVPAITLTGNVGDSVRVDWITRYGPTDAWVPLGTVTLTNTSQLYFDTSALGQPERLYRLVTP
jgi:hypothetical protein